MSSRSARRVRRAAESSCAFTSSSGRIVALTLATLLLLLAGAGSLVASDGDSGGPGVQAETFTLDNGMKFLLVERPEMATVAAAWVAHVGSANERPGITGMAHLFEHMMFKGTRTIGTDDAERDLQIIDEQEAIQDQIRSIYRDLRAKARRGEIEDPYAAENRTPEMLELAKEFDALVEEQRDIMIKDQLDQIYTENGAAALNAFTTNDMTVYINMVPANKIELWFWLESDRLMNPVFREFYTERDVVHEERRMRTEATPTGEFDEQFDAMFWQSHPYSWPTIGWPSDLQVISKSQADEFYDLYYAPNNLTGILVGNFDSTEMKDLATRYFGRLERGDDPPDVVTLEMEQLAEKRMRAECDCQPQIQIRYHTPAFAHRDEYVLDVIADLLNGRTGRLHRAMVEGEEIASQASAFNNADKYAGSFTFTAEAKGEATPADLERVWGEVVDRLKNELVDERELQKVKNLFKADAYRRLESPFFMMFQLALYEGLGDWNYLNTLADRIDAVTAEDVQRVMNTYFEPSNRLVGHYFRKAGTEARPMPPELEALPPEVRTQVTQQLEQVRAIEDAAMLRQVLGQLEAAGGQVPEEMRPAMELLRKAASERLEELESNAAGEEEGS